MARISSGTGIAFCQPIIGACIVSLVCNQVFRDMVLNELLVNKFKQFFNVIVFSVEIQETKI